MVLTELKMWMIDRMIVRMRVHHINAHKVIDIGHRMIADIDGHLRIPYKHLFAIINSLLLASYPFKSLP